MRVTRAVPAPVLVLGSVVSVQFGQATGKGLFETATPAGVVTLRLGLAALILLVIYRPRLPRTRSELAVVTGLGTAIAGMNIVYPAMDHLPVGVATTLQLLGPFTVALLASRRLLDIVWSLIAAVGLVLFAFPCSSAGLPLSGIGLGLLAAVSMGSYILLSKRAGALSEDGSLLALALVLATAWWAPFGIVQNGTGLLEPRLVLVASVVAVLSAALPYSLELVALRELSPRVVGVLQSLEPAAGAIAGFLILTESLTALQIMAIGCVSVASIAAVLTSSVRRIPGQNDFLQSGGSAETPAHRSCNP